MNETDCVGRLGSANLTSLLTLDEDLFLRLWYQTFTINHPPAESSMERLQGILERRHGRVFSVRYDLMYLILLSYCSPSSLERGRRNAKVVEVKEFKERKPRAKKQDAVLAAIQAELEKKLNSPWKS
jgi:hypothetical protein